MKHRKLPRFLKATIPALGLLTLLACGGGGGGEQAATTSSGIIPVLLMTTAAFEHELEPSPNRMIKAHRKKSQGPLPQRFNLFVEGVGSGAQRFPLRQITFDQERNLHGIKWFTNQRVGYLLDPKGDENVRLHAVDIDGSNRRELTPAALADVATKVLCPDPSGGNRWLVEMGPAHGRKDLYWIDVETGEYGLKERNPSNLIAFLPDAQGRILGAMAQKDLEFSFLYRVSEAAPFRTLSTTTFPDLTVPKALDPNGRTAEVYSNVGRDTLAIYQFDLTTGTRGRLIKEEPGKDVAALLELGDSRPQASEWAGNLTNSATYRFNIPRTQKVKYQSSDGVEIMAYLTLPTDVRPMTQPGVVLCHGGPMADTPSEDIEALFLANRGIAVLRPHFRGSAGTGKAFLAKGLGQWGGTMQDDLTCGAKWLAEEGHANASRIAIMGASYGGYAALAGASLTPDTFCCAVSTMGPSSLLSLSASPYWQSNQAINNLQTGNPATDAFRMRAVSPLFNAHRIRIPLLMGHGAKDSRVPITESEQMVQAMAARGVYVPFMTFPNEGHGFGLEENRTQWYGALENFFGMHLGSRVEAPSSFPLTR